MLPGRSALAVSGVNGVSALSGGNVCWSHSQDIARLLFVYFAFNAKQTAALFRYLWGVVPDATGIKPEHTSGMFVKGSSWKTCPCQGFCRCSRVL